MPVGIDPEDVLVLPEVCPCWTWCGLPARAPRLPMPRLSCALPQSRSPLTDAAAGSAVEVLYRMVRDAENLA